MTHPRWARAWRAASVLYAVVWGAACGPARAVGPAAPAPGLPAAPVAASAGAALPSAAVRPRLRVALRPDTGEATGGLHVSITLWGTDSERVAWRVPATWPEAMSIAVTCAQPEGPERTAMPSAADGVLDLQPLAACRHAAAVQLDYVLATPASASPHWQLDERGFVARGRDVLILPARLGEQPVETLVQIDAGAFGSDGRAVSSIGIGAERQAAMTPEALQSSVLAAGWFGSALFETSEGHDEAAWFGSPAFDPRPLAAEVASFRSAARERFRHTDFRPLTLILIVDPRVDQFEVVRAPVSIFVRVAPGSALSPSLRLAILHQVMKEWIGGQLVLEDDAGHELAWFTEGMCRYLSRELAFAFGLLTPAEYIDEVDSLLSTQAILLQRENASCPGSPPSEPGAACVLLDLVRGALHASELDVALRAARGSMLGVLTELVQQRRGRLSLSAWQAVLASAGADRDARLSKQFAQGAAVIPAAAAFGRCYARGPRRYAESLRGFEYSWTSGAPAATVTSVDPRGPAAAAGLRSGDALERIDHLPFAPQRPIVLTRAGGEPLEYQGQLRTVPSVGWTLIADPHDERRPLE